MTDQSENIVGMRKKIKAQAEHIRRLEQRIRELKQAEPATVQDEREAFERYRLAGEFCVSRGIDDDSEIRPKILDAFCADRPAQTAPQPERWHAACGDWRETNLAIHGERSGYIACGIPEAKARAIIKAHNAGASHMLEGFRPTRNKWDELVDGIRAAMAAKYGQ